MFAPISRSACTSTAVCSASGFPTNMAKYQCWQIHCTTDKLRAPSEPLSPACACLRLYVASWNSSFSSHRLYTQAPRYPWHQGQVGYLVASSPSWGEAWRRADTRFLTARLSTKTARGQLLNTRTAIISSRTSTSSDALCVLRTTRQSCRHS